MKSKLILIIISIFLISSGYLNIILINNPVEAENYKVLWESVDNNTPICLAANSQSFPQIISDGNGGAIITWADSRSGSNYHIYAQRVDSTGAVKWTNNGVAICTASNTADPRLTSDGYGGAIITWSDGRNGYEDIYAQRVNSTGSVKWTSNGVAICTSEMREIFPQIISDGSGGAIITWQDYDNVSHYNIYAQRVDSTGAVKWANNGVVISSTLYSEENPQITSDGSGGAIITWQVPRSGQDDIYAQRVDSTGAVKWTSNGVAICTATGQQNEPQIISDGSGGAIITWEDPRSGSGYDIYARCVDSAGTVKWTSNGVAICTASNNQRDPQLISDGSGGAIITWYDYRNISNRDIYAQYINCTGAVKWINNGMAVCSAIGDQSYPQLISDGSGGAIITWQDSRNGSQSDIYAQRVNSTGSIKWMSNGVPVSTATGNQFLPQITSDGSGGAIITWYDSRSSGSGLDIYAQHIGIINITTKIPDTTLYEDKLYSYDFNSTDNANTTWSLDKTMSWYSINANNGIFEATPTYKQIGNLYTINVIANRTGVLDDFKFTFKVNNTNPKFTAFPSDPSIMDEDALYTFDINCTDEHEGNSAFSLINGPSWLTIDNYTGELSGMPNNSQVGQHLIDISVNDGFGGIVNKQFNLIVNNINDAPEIITTDIITAIEDILYMNDYDASDIDPTSDTFKWSINTNCSWLSINNITGVVSGIPENADVGWNWINVSVTDGHDGYDWSNFTVSVTPVNDPPKIITQNILTAIEDVFMK